MIKRRLFTSRKSKEWLAWPAAMAITALIGLMLGWRG